METRNKLDNEKRRELRTTDGLLRGVGLVYTKDIRTKNGSGLL